MYKLGHCEVKLKESLDIKYYNCTTWFDLIFTRLNMLWQCQSVSSRLGSQLSFILVIGSHHNKSNTKTD